MKSKKNIIIAIACTVIIVVIAVIFCNINKKDNTDVNNKIQDEKRSYFVELSNGIKQNISEKIAEKRTFENLDIVNTSIVYSEGNCKMKLEVENNTNYISDDIMIKINILDENGNSMITLNGFIASINPGKSTEVNMNSSNFDFTNAYDYEILRK